MKVKVWTPTVSKLETQNSKLGDADPGLLAPSGAGIRRGSLPARSRWSVMPVALRLQAVRARYGDRVAVDGLTLAVAAGEVVGLIGPNGSGKSTTLALAAGVLTPVSGTVTACGIDRAADP